MDAPLELNICWKCFHAHLERYIVVLTVSTEEEENETIK